MQEEFGVKITATISNYTRKMKEVINIANKVKSMFKNGALNVNVNASGIKAKTKDIQASLKEMDKGLEITPTVNTQNAKKKIKELDDDTKAWLEKMKDVKPRLTHYLDKPEKVTVWEGKVPVEYDVHFTDEEWEKLLYEEPSEELSKYVEEGVSKMDAARSKFIQTAEEIRGKAYTPTVIKDWGEYQKSLVPKEDIGGRIEVIKTQIQDLNKIMGTMNPKSEEYQVFANYIEKSEKEVEDLTKDLENATDKTNKFADAQKNAKTSTGSVNNSIGSSSIKFKSLSNMLKGTKPEIGAIISGVEKLANKMKSTFKKMVLAIVGVRSAFFAMRKAVSSYLAFDEELTKTLRSSWAGLGAQLAPMIEYVINLFAKLVGYINALIAGLTGLNMIARANAKALKVQAKAGKEAAKSLTALDEITNISDDKGSGDDNTIKLPEAPLDDFLKLFLEKIRIGDWYEAGRLLAEKINDTLKSINWDKIKKTAGDIGKNIALFLNGGIENANWKLTGNTLAEGLNTALNFLYKFITTFNFSAFGKGIVDTINGFFKKANWKKIGKTIQNAISGVLDFGRAFFENIDVDLITDSLDKLFSSINWDEFWEKWYQLMLVVSPKINWFVAKLLWVILKAAIDGFASWVTVFTESGLKIGKALIKGLVNGIADKLFGFIQWLNDKFNEVIESIREKLGIHSPSTVMYQIGEDLIQGLINGIGDIWDKVKVKFEEFKTKMTDKINEISNIKFEITAKIKTNLNDFKKKMSKIFSNNDVLTSIFNWGASAINQAQKWISSLDTGTGYVPEDQMAYIHKGEAVIPKKFNSAEYFSNINNNTETNNLLLEANRTLIDILEKDNSFYVNGKELARTTYNDFQEEGNRINKNNIVKVG